MIKTPLLHPVSLFLVGLALSIGWGIRGNYGHETGAMLPGALAAISICLLSGRPDWHPRVGYFALFGMLGWAVGGSMSYMMIIGYTQSGHAETQLFGYFGLFVVGFLWAGFGGAATALPAVMREPQLRAYFVPLATILAVWTGLYFTQDWLTNAIQMQLELDGIESPMRRQERALYWLDSDWFQVSIVLTSLLIFDLIQRRFEKTWLLFGYAACGGLAFYLIILALHYTTGTNWIGEILVQPQGRFEDRYSDDQLAVTNWPKLFLYLGSRPGLIYQGEVLALGAGVIAGVGLYFLRHGKFALGSGLFLWMMVGWLIAFVTLPVLGSLALPQIGGLRMTPARGDNWAGVLGALVAGFIYCWRHHLRLVVVAGLISGSLGGIAFSAAAWIEACLVSFGNRNRLASPEQWTNWQQTTWEPTNWTSGERMPAPNFLSDVPPLTEWNAWQGQNWHSVLEQNYGFMNGLAVAIAMGVLATRVPRREVVPSGARWMMGTALVFVLPVLTYVNLVKNLRPWSESFGGHQSIPDAMTIPWTTIELSQRMWFDIVFLAGLISFILVLVIHWHRGIAILKTGWIGRGQMLFLVLLWTMVVGNFTRALPTFTSGRIVTEGMIYLNALFASILILAFPTQAMIVKGITTFRIHRLLLTSIGLLIFCATVFPATEWWTTRRIYGDAYYEKRGLDFRLGPNANWKRDPLLKDQLHR